jgi:glycosyltransferase involved in cell wall biosynthesis
MTPRILFLDHVGVLGGAELSLLDVARHFAGASRVALFEDGPFRRRLEEAGVGVDVLAAPDSVKKVSREGGKGGDLRSLPGVMALAWRVARRAREFDVVYANSQKSFVVGSVAARLARKPMIWHLRDLLTGDHFSASHRRLAVTLGNALATRVIANSEATAQAFVESGGRAGKVRVVYNGFDPAPFEAVTPEEAAAARAEIGLGDAPTVGVFSRLSPWKGQHVLLDALTRAPGLHAVLVGGALFGDEERYAASLHEKVVASGLSDRVHFLGFRRDVPRLLHAVDVVAHTSVAPEPFGRVVVEGMLAGKPVVATRAGGVLEIVEDGVTGRLVPPGDAETLAGTLRALFADPAQTAAMAAAAREAARRRFSRETMLEGVERQINEVAGFPVVS